MRKYLLCLLLMAAAGPQGWAAAACSDKNISVHCGKTPSAIWQEDTLWIVFSQGEHVYVAHSKDKGDHYSTPVRVNSEPETIETNGENRPKIALTDEAVLVSWTQKTEGHFTGDIRFSRSVDGGRTFAQVKTINDDGLLTSHRFDSLLASSSGTVYLTWLDKRNKLKAEKKGDDYSGSALYYAISVDHGKTFSTNFAVADNSCECCRIAVATADDDNLAIFWRHIYGVSQQRSIRDHGLAIVSPTGRILSRQRVTFDDWQINACPHHGPDIAPASHGGYHLAWFSDGSQQKGILYGFYDSAKKATRHIATMDLSAGASHPQVLELNNKVYFAWKLFDGEHTQVRLARSNDAGESWSEPHTLALTAGASDHPLLIASTDNVYLTWHTQNEGFRVIAAEITTADRDEQR